MPFLPESVTLLRERLSLSVEQLKSELEKFVAEHSVDAKKSYSPQTIYFWENGKSSPKMRELDLLYRYANYKGMKDIDFYARPTNPVNLR